MRFEGKGGGWEGEGIIYIFIISPYVFQNQANEV